MTSEGELEHSEQEDRQLRYNSSAINAGRPSRKRKRRQENASRAVVAAAVVEEEEDDDEDDDLPASEARSCENCRRCKLKCSRSNPCTKCVLKGVTCVYEQSNKKRGPRPGYIEELYRRIDALENMVLGQSLLLGGSSRQPVRDTLRDEVNTERERLGELGQAYCRQSSPHHTLDQHLSGHGSSSKRLDRIEDSLGSRHDAASCHQQHHLHFLPQRQQPSPANSAPYRDSRHRLEVKFSGPTNPSPEEMVLLRDVFRHQIQPWLPIVRQSDIDGRLASYEPTTPLDTILQMVLAAASPHMASVASCHSRYFDMLLDSATRGILQLTKLDDLRSALLLQFLLFGKGLIGDYWGLVTYPAQLALRLGLHLEDHHLADEHLRFREVVGLVDEAATTSSADQTWARKETTRRLFWGIFLQDQFAAVFSGTGSSFDATSIRRLLPCDGRHWQENWPVNTHEFVPASVAVQVQMLSFADAHVGGLAYLIEATEIHAMVVAFMIRARDARRLASSAPPSGRCYDLRSYLQEFLNLDLIMTNWKARLPPRYQQASYDDNGYMDHNVTLAHLTHNTTGILLYQWPQLVCRDTSASASAAAASLHSTLLPQVSLVRQAAKEIAKICTRFLMHRSYLVSPQFSYCQFVAARALLVYAEWTAEPVDDDYKTISASLAEAAKRWEGGAGSCGDSSDNNHKGGDSDSQRGLSNLASMLLWRLKIDAQHPEAIDLTTPVMRLLREVKSLYQAHPSPKGGMLGNDSGPVCGQAEEQDGMNTALPTSAPDDDFDRVMSSLVSAHHESLDNRIFSWQDCPTDLSAPASGGMA